MWVKNRRATLLIRNNFRIKAKRHRRVSLFLEDNKLLYHDLFLMRDVSMNLFTYSSHTNQRRELYHLSNYVRLSARVSHYLFLFKCTIRRTNNCHLTQYNVSVFGLTAMSFLSIITSSMMRIMLIRVNRKRVVTSFRNKDLLIRVGRLSILMCFSRLFYLQLSATIKMCRTISTRVTIKKHTILTVVTTVNPMFAIIIYLNNGTLICPIPSATTLRSKVFLSSIPMILRITRTITRNVNVLTGGRKAHRLLIPNVLFRVKEKDMRQTMSIHVPFRRYTFVLSKAAIRHLRNIMNGMRVRSISNFITRQPSSS